MLFTAGAVEYSVSVPCSICTPTRAFAPERVQVVQLRAGGTLGTQVWPLSLDLQKTVASLAGRLCATMVAGMQTTPPTTPPHQGIHITGCMKQLSKCTVLQSGNSQHVLFAASCDFAWFPVVGCRLSPSTCCGGTRRLGLKGVITIRPINSFSAFR